MVSLQIFGCVDNFHIALMLFLGLSAKNKVCHSDQGSYILAKNNHFFCNSFVRDTVSILSSCFCGVLGKRNRGKRNVVKYPMTTFYCYF